MEREKTGEKGKRAWLFPVLALLVLFLSMGCVEDPSEAAGDYEEIKGELLPYWGTDYNWLPICIMAVITTVLLHTIVFMLGQAINSEQMKRYAVSEMLHASATALMAIILIGALIQSFDYLASLGTVTCEGCEDGICKSPIEADACRTSEILDEVGKLYNTVKDQDAGWEILCSLQVTVFGIPVFNGCWMIEAVYNRVETYHSIAYICVNLMIGLSTKLFLLKYIHENMLAVFLPLGIILRTFHFTRGIGAFFMALAVGFFFIYPTVTFIMDSSFMGGLESPELPETIVSGMCNIPMFGSFSFGAAALASYGERSGSASQVSLSHELSSFVAQIQAALLFNTMVAFAITLTFVRFATTILGGDIAPFMGMVGRLV